MYPAGTLVGVYSLEFPIARGGAAWVYAARHDVLGTRHAVKVLHDAPHPGRFAREARLQARLGPRYVVPITDVVEEPGVAALVMPLVEGTSLARLLAEHRPSPPEARALVEPIVDAMARAHRLGIVHRDLKPGNVLLEMRHGRLWVRVSDFGIAKSRSADSTNTETESFLGTRTYAAPEQLRDAASVDARADVWSIGAVLHELLTGAPPPPGGPADAVPMPWAPLLDALLAVDPAKRPPDGQAVATLLEALDVAPATIVEGHRLATALDDAWRTICRDGEVWRQLRAAETTTGSTGLEPVGLPRERDAFVGRVEELAALAAVLAPGTVVALVGLGGVGKTRLALHHAWRSRDQWPGGTWFVDLAEARTRSDVVGALAEALRVRLDDESDVGRLARAIDGRGRCLLVVDNCEQLQDHLAATVHRWAAQAPEATWLLTSRRVPEVPGEIVVRLGGLSDDDARTLFDARASSDRATSGELADYRDEVMASIASLDGLPLAIELAAAQAARLGIPDLLASLPDRLRWAAHPTTNPRHETLRSTLEWSWQLLAPRPRRALGCLVVFDGDFSAEAAQAVLDDDDQPFVLDLVGSLVDQSWLRVLGNGRFELLPTVREYAATKLEDRATAEVRHGRYFAQFGTLEALEAPPRPEATRRERLRTERSNLARAVERAVARGDARTAELAAVAAWTAIEDTGPYAQGLGLLERAAALPHGPALALARIRARIATGHLTRAEAELRQLEDESGPEPEREMAAELADHRGQLADRRGDLRGAVEAWTAARRGFRALGRGRRETAVLWRLGKAELLAGEHERGRDRLEFVRTRLEREGDTLAVAETDIALATTHVGEEALERAETTLTGALATLEAHGHLRGVAELLTRLAYCVHRGGRSTEALALYAEAGRRCRQLGDRLGEIEVLEGMGLVERVLGKVRASLGHHERMLALCSGLGVHDRAARARVYVGGARAALGEPGIDELFERAVNEFQRLGRPHDVAFTRAYAGAALVVAKRDEDARHWLESALAAGRSLEVPPIVAVATGNLGILAFREGNLDEAARLFAVAKHANEDSPWSVTARILEAEVALASGDLESAHRRIESAAARIRHNEFVAPRAHLACLRVLLALARGDEATARAKLTELEHFADLDGAPATERAAETRRRVEAGSADQGRWPLA